MFAQKYIDSFWNRVERRGPNDCWEWKGAHDTYGYGNVFIGSRKTTKAHRFSYILAYGDIPLGLQVCHTCDNPSCVNPNHFFLGTHRDNCLDKEKKHRGNHPHGVGVAHAKLTEKQVLEIRATYKPFKVTEKMLAEKYGVGKTVINNIIHRKKWSHLP